MKSYSFHEEAERELIDATKYYESEKTGLAAHFRQEVDEAIRIVCTNPQAFEPLPRSSCRQFIIARFAYSLIYLDAPTEVRIFAVAHHKRKPGYWNKRSKT